MAPRSQIPPEFRGKARVLHARVQAADSAYIAAVSDILHPLKERLSRKPTVRDAQALDIVRAFRALAHPFRFCSDVDVPRKGHLCVTDIVLGCTKAHQSSWDPDNLERGLAILRSELSTQGGLKLRVTPLVCVSLHAISRWFQRAAGPHDDARLLADLTALLAPHVGDWIAVSGGFWLGAIVPAHDGVSRQFRVRQIRTYLHEDQVEDGPENYAAIAARPEVQETAVMT